MGFNYRQVRSDLVGELRVMLRDERSSDVSLSTVQTPAKRASPPQSLTRAYQRFNTTLSISARVSADRACHEALLRSKRRAGDGRVTPVGRASAEASEAFRWLLRIGRSRAMARCNAKSRKRPEIGSGGFHARRTAAASDCCLLGTTLFWAHWGAGREKARYWQM
ncbi:hypothetical protein EJ06DRAFT_520262 [Trichodelitschia bisporula]|uniref:Uncharacterized protein n=1 Tax=Trichodelitschia bisporula TaxID=703511 RepID=A0A6G1I2B2_9PEZI|nr:hypothetical protein EJ06DRAFT_520262 [Trichodelitschia bisporula]